MDAPPPWAAILMRLPPIPHWPASRHNTKALPRNKQSLTEPTPKQDNSEWSVPPNQAAIRWLSNNTAPKPDNYKMRATEPRPFAREEHLERR